jgi:opacity protein-like surface antigen
MYCKPRSTISHFCLWVALGLSPCANAQWEGNWLIGVSGGLAEREGNFDLVIHHAQGPTSSLVQNQEDSGLFGGLFGGYQIRCNDWLMGAELNVEWQDLGRDQESAFTNALRQGTAITTRYSQTNVVALTGRFGYEIFPNFLPYIRAGIQTSRDKLDFFGFPIGGGAVDLESLRRVWRFTGGFGVEAPIPVLMGLSVRAEYNFQAKAGAIEADALGIDNATLVNTSMRPKTNAILLSAVINLLS